MEKGSEKTYAEVWALLKYFSLYITTNTVLLLFQLAQPQSTVTSACEITHISCLHIKICFNVDNNKYMTDYCLTSLSCFEGWGYRSIKYVLSYQK